MRRWIFGAALAAMACTSAPAGGGDAAADAADGTVDAADESVDVVAPPREYPMPAAANAVPRTDPRWNGQWHFLYNAWGTEALGEWPPAEFLLRLMRDEPAVFGDQFARFGFVPDPNDDFPVGFKRGAVDRTRVRETCALCHVGRLPDGRTWFGLPNTRLDFARFRVEVNRRWVAAGNAPLMTELEAQKALQLGPGRTGAETGDYPQVVPADFPPYFTLGRRTALNYMGTSQNLRSEVFLAIFSLGAGAPNDREARVPFPEEERVDEFLAFLGTMEPPAPPTGDSAAIAQGRMVFERARCGTCHHVGALAMDGVTAVDRAASGRERFPGDDPAFPRGSVRTSPVHRRLQDGDEPADGGTGDAGSGTGDAGDAGDAGGGTGDAGPGVDEGFANYILFILRRHLSVGMTDGYRVGDLRGLAYTAPYLHNGSVPTLEDLLRPRAQRPATFVRDGFTVDTTRLGNGNEGHEFGSDLNDADRSALVAYLRSL